MIEKKKKEHDTQNAVLVGLVSRFQSENEMKEYMMELAFLAETAGLKPIKTVTQKLDKPDPRTFIGSGKIFEIKAFLEENDTRIVIFDDELSPSQLRNTEKDLGVAVLDRTGLILDIFAQRARTSHARTQVELAQYQYILPRLKRMWTHLERQKGGIGMRGPGETQLETDQRIIRNKISKLKEELKLIDRQMATQRQGRGELVRVALVGYTNVGKSTLMNVLSKSEVFAENKLFATLDTTVRKVVLDRIPFLLSDTVGFIRKLPTQLIESFKSTLDEVREADLLLHVVDISHPRFEEHIRVVNQTLIEIGAGEKTTMMVFNKIDNYLYVPKEEDDLSAIKQENIPLLELKKTWMATVQDAVFISATDRLNVSELRTKLLEKVQAIHNQRYPNNKL